MKKHLVAYGLTLGVFLAIDALWLGVVARGFYIPRLEAAGIAVEVDYAIAGVFYAFFVVGLVIFAVAPALERRSARHAAVFGGLFGVFTYATYDLTNLATLQNWPVIVSAVDIVWGGALNAVTAWLGYKLTVRSLGDAA